ncbi:hypothetical protein RMATCC62417_00899 [Rhizopus microsporus]|nr:hypothetical protein RMATCC62417_00899 [Rhizopus microsporus]
MAICKFYQSGTCRNGNNCNFQHVKQGNTLNSAAPKYNETSLRGNLTDERPQWKLSVYGPAKEEPNMIVGTDRSPEEDRCLYYLCRSTTGNESQYLTSHEQLSNQMEAQVNAIINNPTGAIQHYEKEKSARSGPFGGTANDTPFAPFTGSGFGATAAKPFGTTTTAFGSSSTPTAFGAPAFGTTAFGSTSSPSVNAFGSKSAFGSSTAPAFGSTSTLGSTAPAFGSTSTLGASAPAFGSASTLGASAPAFGSTSTLGSGSAFGQKSTLGSAFGQTSSLGSGSAFGQTSTLGSAFGKSNAVGSGTAFGQTTPAFGQATSFGNLANNNNTTAPAFGATSTLGTGTTAFGSTNGLGNTTTAFGQNNAFTQPKPSIDTNGDPQLEAFVSQEFTYRQVPEIEPPPELR